jgi:ribonuclease P protein component
MTESPFPRTFRLTRQADFDRVHRENRFAADETLVIRAVSNGSAVTRMGISLSRQVGNAVHRNRWKRLIREAFRLARGELPAGLDIVIRPRRGAVPERSAIDRSLRRLLPRLARQLRQDGP